MMNIKLGIYFGLLFIVAACLAEECVKPTLFADSMNYCVNTLHHGRTAFEKLKKNPKIKTCGVIQLKLCLMKQYNYMTNGKINGSNQEAFINAHVKDKDVAERINKANEACRIYANTKKLERKVANRFYDCIHEKPEILDLIYEKLCIKFPNLNGTTVIPTVDNSVTENSLNNELETDNDNDD